MNLLQLLPKSRSDAFAFVFSLFGINAIFFVEMFAVLPWLAETRVGYGGSFQYYFHQVTGWFIYVNSLASFWKTIATDTTSRNIILPSILKQGWRFCSVCEANAPPRSYHCHVCKRCILKRDHHCVFTGNCIGHANHRYYIMLIFYCLVASVYANFMNTDFMWYVVGEFSLKAIFNLIFPFFSWVVQMISFSTMCLSAVLLLCITVSLILTALLAYHLQNLYQGQITHERSHKISKYNLGWRANVESVFGVNWKFAWISPFIPSQLPGNGLEFPISGIFEAPKDM